MTEQQLREKLQFAYGNMPDATRAAFEHSLTHHRAPETHRNIGLSRACIWSEIFLLTNLRKRFPGFAAVIPM